LAFHIQISEAVVAAIKSNRLQPGSPLPGSRELAERLAVNRKTVQLAYEELVNRGWATAEGRRGTFVSLRLLASMYPSGETAAGPGPVVPIARRVVPAAPVPGMIIFDDGAPDTRLLPVSALAQAYRGALLQLSRSNRLADEDALGSFALRMSVSTMLNFNRGMATTPERICLTRGSQMAIFLAARILAGPGKAVAMEEPGYAQARSAFRGVGAELVPIPVDSQGLQVDELERACQERRFACVYVTPHHQFPTTVALSAERRKRLMELSDHYGFTILEDDYDHEFHFTGKPILPLASLNPDANIVYVGSFSKLLSPHLRSGFISAPAWFIRQASAMVAQIDRLGDPVTELALADLITSGEVKRHYDKARRVYDQRRQRLGEVLQLHFGSSARFLMPDGGLAYWVEFDFPFGTAKFAARTRAAGVRLLPTRLFWIGRPKVQATRIGFAHLTTVEIAEALRRVRHALDCQFRTM
jgi:GntR family transcriptional regulator/MocR family aminotransferase